jgi:simple sugar transport system permease protein
MSALGQIFNGSLWSFVVLDTSTILLAGLGGAFTQQANILNVALDGMMLIGAFAGIAVGAATQSIALAVLAAMGAGLVLSLLFGWASLWLGADFIVAGVGIGLLTSGLSIFLLERLYHNEGSFTPFKFPNLPAIHLGPFVHIPVLGPALEGQSILVAVAILLVPTCHWVLYHTSFGTHVRAVGEDEAAVVAAGLRPRRIKMGAVLISGVLCGLAGAELAMGTLDQFVSGMTAGRGFIALAAIFVGRATPVGTFIGSLVFGLASALANQLQQVLNLPSNLLFMVPYVATVVVLLGRPVLSAYRLRRTARQVPEALAQT